MNKLVAISAFVLGFGLGAWWGYRTGSIESPVLVASTGFSALVKHEPSLSPGRADIDWAVLRAVIREEMTVALAGRGGNGPAAPTSVKDAVSPETLTQRREAQEQIDTIMSQGVWGNAQRLSFQQKLVMLDPEQKERALQQLTTAINSGTLQISTDGPPL
jgi:hypothetical protein